MRTLRRYLRLLGIQLRASLLLSMQYRFDFLLELVMVAFWSASSLVPLLVLFQMRTGVAGWTWPEALVVFSFFMIVKGILSGAIQPALGNAVEHIRKGTLDFLLLKPADAQFLVSTARFDFARVSDLLGGSVLLGYAVMHTGRVPTLTAIGMTLLLLLGAVSILYSIWLVLLSLAFLVVKVDNLSHLFLALYDAARWPSTVFQGLLSFLFTFVIPLALMTTYPALAILDRIEPLQALLALGTAAVFLVMGRMVWLLSIRRYTSAGG